MSSALGLDLDTSDRQEEAESEFKRVVNRIQAILETYDQHEESERDTIDRYLDTFRSFDSSLSHNRPVSWTQKQRRLQQPP